MHIVMYTYARPLFLELTCRSLFFASPSVKLNLVLNKSDCSDTELALVKRLIYSYPDQINSVIFLDSNYGPNAVDIGIQQLPLDQDIVCITEDDLIIPTYFKQKGDFIQKLVYTCKLGYATGVQISEYNHYESPQKFKQSNDFIRIGCYYLTIPKSHFNTLTTQFKRVPRDTEMLNGYQLVVNQNEKVYHLGWDRESIYPEYYKLLYQQRIIDNWKDVYCTPSKDPIAEIVYKDRKWEYNVPIRWSWSK